MRKSWRLPVGIATAVLLVALATVLVLPHLSAPGLRDDARIVPASGVARGLDEGKDTVSFMFGSNHGPRYWIANPDPAVLEALHDSASSGNSVKLHTCLEGAWLEGAQPQYWVESLTYLGKQHRGFATRPRNSWRALSPAAAGLLRGVAFSEARRRDEAMGEIERAIGGDSLRKEQLALAYLTRGSLRESLAYPPGSGLNDRDDKLLVDAEGDYRRAAELDPADERTALWRGDALSALGAYTEALVLYEEVEQRWPDQYFRVAMRKAATFRLMGDPRAALRVLNELVEVHGPQGGMMYHYHRAWTLYQLRLYKDAAEELELGIRDQPDYTWAFVRRACAHAQAGDLEHAWSDQQRALELWDQGETEIKTPDGERIRGEIVAAMNAFDAARQTHSIPMTAEACTGVYEGPHDGPRKRSRLLPPAATRVAAPVEGT